MSQGPRQRVWRRALVRRELVGRVFGVPGPEDTGSACFLAGSADRNQAVCGWVDAEMRPDAWTGAQSKDIEDGGLDTRGPALGERNCGSLLLLGIMVSQGGLLNQP